MFSPTDEWSLPAASTVKPEEREFVVDSRARMHMVSKKDVDPAELETVRISKTPTMLVTANGEVPTKEDGTVYVRESDLFVIMLLEDTPAVLSLGYNYHWTSGQKPQFIKNGRRTKFNTANYVPFVVLGQPTSSSSSSSPTSPTSSSHPASTRSEGMSEEVRGDSSHGPAETENPIKMKTTKEYGATRCVICHNGYKSSSEIW